MPSLISIIIPTYNRSHLLAETLDSIIAQTYTLWECIVVDDGSSDYTKELMDFYVNKDSRILFVDRPFNRAKGANACRNYGYEISKGAYINWFDDDDLMHSEKLEIQLNSLKDSKYDYSVCQALVFENTIKTVLGLRNKWIGSDNVFYDYLTTKIGWMTPSALWRKDFLEKQLYLFDEDLKAAQEWEFHLRILNRFPEYAVINDALVYIRKHRNSITYNKNKNQQFWYYFQSRLKIHNNSQVTIDHGSEQFLKEYLLNSFKKMVLDNNKNVFEAYKLFILPESKMSSITKINALLAIGAFKLFNKGNFLLQKIKFN